MRIGPASATTILLLWPSDPDCYGPTIVGSVRESVLEPPKRFVYALPLTERPLPEEPPFPSLTPPSPPPPPPPAMIKASIEQQQGAPAPWLVGLAIDARTRLISSMAARGTRQLTVKLSSGFRAGALAVINPGGTTEERVTVLRPEPFLLTAALRYSHAIGETVVQLAPTESFLEDIEEEAGEQAGEGTAASSASSRLSALLALRDRRAHVRHHRPPSPPPHREAPLLANITQIADGSARFVRTHVGIEAAMALVLAALLSLCSLGCILATWCDYSLCCFSRRKSGQATPREMMSAR